MKDYNIFSNPAYDEHYNEAEEIEIGVVVSKDTEQDVMALLYDKNCYEKYNHHFIVFLGARRDTEEPYPFAIMGDTYRRLFYSNARLFSPLAMHELGHFMNGDFAWIQSDDSTSSDIQALRLKSLLAGEVAPEELNADIFALQQCGWKDFRDALNFLIRLRKERNDSVAALVIKEFELRKEAAKAYYDNQVK